MSINQQNSKPTRRQEEDKDLGVVADELDAMAGVDGGGAEPALLQPHGAASFLDAALPAAPKSAAEAYLVRTKHSIRNELAGLTLPRLQAKTAAEEWRTLAGRRRDAGVRAAGWERKATKGVGFTYEGCLAFLSRSFLRLGDRTALTRRGLLGNLG